MRDHAGNIRACGQEWTVRGVHAVESFRDGLKPDGPAAYIGQRVQQPPGERAAGNSRRYIARVQIFEGWLVWRDDVSSPEHLRWWRVGLANSLNHGFDCKYSSSDDG
jgi:hypothetical protein